MPLVPLRVVLDHAAENNYGVAAFNVNNMEQIQAIMEAARETDSLRICLRALGFGFLPNGLRKGTWLGRNAFGRARVHLEAAARSKTARDRDHVSRFTHRTFVLHG